jgi:hypothetical protein
MGSSMSLYRRYKGSKIQFMKAKRPKPLISFLFAAAGLMEAPEKPSGLALVDIMLLD